MRLAKGLEEKMRIIFMGTPDFAVPSLEALRAAGHDIVAVYSQPPRPANRGKTLTPSPVHARAEALGLPVKTPASLKDSMEQAAFVALDADLAVVAAYGLILPKLILAAPKYGCINVHASLLPRWRGAAPVQRAILAGDAETGVTIMQMEAGLDTGPMRALVSTPIGRKTAGDLTSELARLGAELLIDVLADLSGHPPKPQPENGVTYAAKIDKAESRIDFTHPADQIERQIRAFAPTPGAFFEYKGERFRLLDAEIVAANGPPGTTLDDKLTIACGTAALRPVRLQRAGKSAMSPEDLLRGYPIPEGAVIA